jgi:hypothetical protein
MNCRKHFELEYSTNSAQIQPNTARVRPNTRIRAYSGDPRIRQNTPEYMYSGVLGRSPNTPEYIVFGRIRGSPEYARIQCIRAYSGVFGRILAYSGIARIRPNTCIRAYSGRIQVVFGHCSGCIRAVFEVVLHIFSKCFRAVFERGLDARARGPGGTIRQIFRDQVVFARLCVCGTIDHKKSETLTST